MHLRKMTKADVPAAMRLKDIAGWNQTSRDWERFLDASPEGCFVAEQGGRVCGTVTTIAYEGRFAWIGMVLVDPEYRSRGFGTQLLETAIAYLDAAGIPTLKLDATPQGKPLYEKLGFVPEYEIERWALRAAFHTDGDDTGGVRDSELGIRRGRLRSGDLFCEPRIPNPEPRFPERFVGGEPGSLEDIIRTDYEVFGADRGALLRSLHRDAPGFTISIHNEEELCGYALGRRGSWADHLGPWTALDEAAAHGLLQEFLSRSAGRDIFVDCLKSNPFAGRLLHTAGFEFTRPLTRMARGVNAYPGRPEFLCAILGPEFG
ncbi:MAG: GNAT family N-acetyltransferase [Terriglobia bacterium]